LIEGEAAALMSNAGSVTGVRLADGSEVRARSVILTAGTFMRGTIHIGDKRVSAGRMGEKAADELSLQMESLGAVFGRLKTGTPPRLNGDTIDWSQLELQPADCDPVMLSFLSKDLLFSRSAAALLTPMAILTTLFGRTLESRQCMGGTSKALGRGIALQSKTK
jgi:tRNA uridine 5-carboxymethylaminomethyl modification enzyme